MERNVVTLLFTDIVGSTERAAELRDAGWRDLRQEHDRRVRRELRRFGGHEINTAGDSFLATFQGPVNHPSNLPIQTEVWRIYREVAS